MSEPMGIHQVGGNPALQALVTHWQTSVNGCAGTTPSGAARTVISKLGLAGAFEQKLTVFCSPSRIHLKPDSQVTHTPRMTP